MEIAGLLAVATDKCEGEVTREINEKIIQAFEKEFGLKSKFAMTYLCLHLSPCKVSLI